MKKFFNASLLMLACLAMTTVFTACEEEGPQLTFTTETGEIAAGSTFTSTTLDPTMQALGITRFAPGISLTGDTDGKIIVEVKSLNETMIEVCAFSSCQITLPLWNWATSVKGDIAAGQELALDIHYTPVGDATHHRAEALITAYYEGYEEKAVNFKLVMTDAKEV